MAIRNTMPSNGTGLAIAVERYPGILPSEDAADPGVNYWFQMEPNEYGDFGQELELVARQPITKDRQRKKGVVIGGEPAGSFVNDVTPTEGIKELLSGFFYSAIRRKKNYVGTAVTATGYTVAADGDDMLPGDLIYVTGSPIAANNGLKVVGSSSTGTEIKVAGLSADAGDVMIYHVGFQFTAADAAIDATENELPVLTTAAKDTSQLGLIPGEFVFIGGDGAATRFNSTENSGWARVKSVGNNSIYFDKTDYEFVDDVGTGKTIHLYFGDVIKNETGSLIARKTFRIERSLGAPDSAAPNDEQGDYLKRAVANELTMTIGEKEIATFDFAFMAGEYGVLTADDGLHSGTREVLAEVDAYNTAGDIKRERLAVYPSAGSNTSAPTPLFALIQETEITINNNNTGVNAHKYIGFVDIVEGMFEFGGSMTAKFATVEAIQAIQDNRDVTYDLAFCKNNRGLAIDMPMIALGDGDLEIEVNQEIRIPLDLQASTGAKYDTAMNHTGLMVFFNYLPTFANRRVD